MHHVHRSALVPYSSEQMFNLVNQIEHYSEFIPHCSKTEIHERSEKKIRASIYLKKGPFSQSFTTKNILNFPHTIQLNLINGPFSNFEGSWEFENLGDLNNTACKVSLRLNFKIQNSLLNRLFASLFEHLANQMLDAFCQRAEKIYGKN